MTATITHDPGVTPAGKARKYAVEVKDNDWPAFAELVEELDGEKVSVTAGDAVLTFETRRERLSWADGFRQGVKFASADLLLVDWLEAWLREQTATDEMDKTTAARRVAICAEKMSPKTRDRGAKLVQALERWRKS
jgi:hypothetical protein